MSFAIFLRVRGFHGQHVPPIVPSLSFAEPPPFTEGDLEHEAQEYAMRSRAAGGNGVIPIRKSLRLSGDSQIGGKDVSNWQTEEGLPWAER